MERVIDRLCFKMESRPFAEIGRVAAEVDRDVPDVPGEYADKLALGLAELVVQTAENPFAGERVVVLDEFCGQVVFCEGLAVENFREPPATIPEASGFYQLYVVESSVDDIHGNSLASSYVEP